MQRKGLDLRKGKIPMTSRNHRLNKIAKRRHYKDLKRKGKKYGSSRYFKFKKIIDEVDKKIIAKAKCNTSKFLTENEIFSEFSNPKNYIEFPSKFAFTTNYDESIKSIMNAVYTYDNKHEETITLSFKNCVDLEISCLFVLEKLLLEINQHKERVLSKRARKPNKLKVIKSQSANINKRLSVFDLDLLQSIEENDTELIPIGKISKTGKKTSKSYVESRKIQTTKQITSFINEKLKDDTLFELSRDGIKNFEGIISETIDNCEQHSYLSGEWFVSAYFFEDRLKRMDQTVVEIQLHFLNLGSSIYESFMKKEKENKQLFSILKNQAFKLIQQNQVFTEENIFTLLSLNEGVSSLKFKDNSRGTGSIRLLESFFDIGDYQDSQRGIDPIMMLVSGRTKLLIDNNNKCFKSKISGKINIALNKERDINKPPDTKYIHKLKEKFPGTLISLRVYLNNKHLKEKFI